MKLHKELIIQNYHCSSIEFVYSRLTVEIHMRLLFIHTPEYMFYYNRQCLMHLPKILAAIDFCFTLN